MRTNPENSDGASNSSVTLPQEIPSIGHEAFEGYNNLQTITLPQEIPSIGHEAFEGCSNLQTITLPQGITTIDTREAFQKIFDCRNLQSIIVPPETTYIGNHALKNCSNLQTITLPKEVQSMGTRVFWNCPSLHSIIIDGSDEDCQRIKALLPAELRDKVTSAHLAAQAYQALEAQLENTASLNPLYRYLSIYKDAPSMRINGQQQDTAKEYPLLPDELFQHMNGFIADSLPAYQEAKSLMHQQPLPTSDEALLTYRKTLEHIVNIALAMHAQQYQSDFAKHLYFLKRKSEFFARNQQQPAAEVVETLCTQLTYSYINTLPNNEVRFQKECEQALQEARKKLQQCFYATDKHSFFSKTTTAKQLDTLEDKLLNQTKQDEGYCRLN